MREARCSIAAAASKKHLPGESGEGPAVRCWAMAGGYPLEVEPGTGGGLGWDFMRVTPPLPPRATPVVLKGRETSKPISRRQPGLTLRRAWRGRRREKDARQSGCLPPPHLPSKRVWLPPAHFASSRLTRDEEGRPLGNSPPPPSPPPRCNADSEFGSQGRFHAPHPEQVRRGGRESVVPL